MSRARLAALALGVAMLAAVVAVAGPRALGAGIWAGGWRVPLAVGVTYTWIQVSRLLRVRALLPYPPALPELAAMDALSFAVLNLVPARVGEIAMPWLLTRGAQVTWGEALSAMAVARMLDLFGLAALVGLAVLVGAGGEQVVPLAFGLAAIGAAGVGALAGAGDRIGAFVGRFSEEAGALIGSVGEALRALARRPRAGLVAAVHTGSIWVADVLSLWVPLWVLAPDQATASAGISGFIGLILGVLLVPTPGALGSADAGGTLGLVAAGVEVEVASAVVLMLHGFGMIHTLGTGVLGGWMLGMGWKEVMEAER